MSGGRTAIPAIPTAPAPQGTEQTRVRRTRSAYGRTSRSRAIVAAGPAFEFRQDLCRLFERSQIRIIVEHPRVDHLACEEHRLPWCEIKLGELGAYPLRSPVGCLLFQITRFMEQRIDRIRLEI